MFLTSKIHNLRSIEMQYTRVMHRIEKCVPLNSTCGKELYKPYTVVSLLQGPSNQMPSLLSGQISDVLIQ